MMRSPLPTLTRTLVSLATLLALGSGGGRGGTCRTIVQSSFAEGATAPPLPALPANVAPTDAIQDRVLLDLPTPFDYYARVCHSSCGGGYGTGQSHDDASEEPFYNPCPKCPTDYASAHCNSCCADGASSLKIRWNGCPGTFTLASIYESPYQCNVGPSDVGFASPSAAGGPKFVSCDCYDSILRGNVARDELTGQRCDLHDSITFLDDGSTADRGHYDICIVSTTDEYMSNDVEWTRSSAEWVDLTKPLPTVLGLKQTAPTDEEGNVLIDADAPDWNYYPLVTYFDTSCDSTPFALPVFPGYGKFANTCPAEGLIDLNAEGKPGLPDGSIDHYDGSPPMDTFWFEFIDGTSAGFWPDETTDSYDPDAASYFDSSFATCSCVDCPVDDAPTASPTAGRAGTGTNPIASPSATESPTGVRAGGANPHPTADPTAGPTASPATVSPTGVRAGTGTGCTAESYAACADFAESNCVGAGVDGINSAGEVCVYPGGDIDGPHALGPEAETETETDRYFGFGGGRGGGGGRHLTLASLVASDSLTKERVLNAISYHEERIAALRLQLFS